MRRLSSLILVALLLCSWAAFVSGQTTGAKFTLTQYGVNQIASDIIPYVVTAIQNAPIPDVDGETSVAVLGTVDYSITNIRLATFNIGTFAVTLMPPSTISTVVSKVDIKVTMDWHWRQKHFPHTSSKGHAEAHTYGASITVPMSVTLNYQLGKPVLAVTNVKVSLPKFNIHISGGFDAWWINLFESIFQGQIKRSIETVIVQTIQLSVNQIANQAIDSLNLVQPVTSNVEVDFSFVSENITPTYVDFGAKGEFYYIPNPQEAPVNAPALPDTVNGEMLQMVLSEFTPNSAFYVFYTAGSLWDLITADELPADSPVQLNTAFFKPLAPKLYNMYPDQPMQLNITATSAPTISFIPEGAAANFNMLFDFQVPLEDGTFFDAFAISVVLSTQVELHTEPLPSGQLVLAGSMKFLKFSMSTKYSHVGLLPLSLFNPIIQVFIQAKVVPSINAALAKGFPLPHVSGITFLNPMLSYGNGYAAITSDITFKPTN